MKETKINWISIIIFFAAALFVLSSGTAYPASTSRIDEGDAWHYFKGETEPPHKWSHYGFDDTGWEKGASGIGYGRVNIRTHLRDMRGVYSKIYGRREFTVRNPALVNSIRMSVFCDGPFSAYLNGIEIVRYTIPQAPSGHSRKAAAQPELLDLSGVIHELLQGKNLLAIECNNDDINSHDFSFTPFFEVIEE